MLNIFHHLAHYLVLGETGAMKRYIVGQQWKRVKYITQPLQQIGAGRRVLGVTNNKCPYISQTYRSLPDIKSYSDL